MGQANLHNTNIPTDKPFKTIDEQIDILKKDRKLRIIDEANAKHFLHRHSYYDLINGYKDCFLDSNALQETFRPEATFEKIVSLYQFDKNLRNVVVSATSDAESILHCALALSVGETYGEKETGYLNRTNFTTGRHYQDRNGNFYTQRDRLLKNMYRIIHDDEEPMHHYRIDHHNVPPWILVEGMNMGNYCNYYELSHEIIKKRVISKVLNIDINEISEAEKEFFRKCLDILRRFRNRAAHGRRMFNYRSPEELTYIPSIYERLEINKHEFDSGMGKNDFLALLISLFHIYRSDRPAFFRNFCLFFSLHAENYYDEDPDNFYEILNNMSVTNRVIKIYFPELQNRLETKQKH